MNVHKDTPLNDENMLNEVLFGKRTLIQLSHKEQENLKTSIINNSICMAMA